MKEKAEVLMNILLKITKTVPAALLVGTLTCLLALTSYASQDPPGCFANNLNVNIGVSANNITNGTLVTWIVTIQNPTNLPGSCSVTLGSQGLYFDCPAADGTPTGTRTTLIPGGTTLAPGFGLQTFNIQCLVNVTGLTAVGEVVAPGSVVHKNPLQDDPANVDKTISVNVFRPCISLSSVCTSAVSPTGSSVTVNYTGTVTNCGNVLLQNVTVVANQPAGGTVVLGPITLQAGAITNFTASYVKTDNLCGPFPTALLVTGIAPLDIPVTVSASSSSQCSISYQPGIRVTSSCPAGPVQPGDLLTISGVVSNTGNIALTNVTVINSKPAANHVLLGPVTLAVGQALPYTGSYAVPNDSCPPYVDTVVAQGTPVCGSTAVSSQAPLSCQGTNSPALVVSKICPANPVPPGGTLAYTGTVTNTGNITLTNVVVVSDQPSANTRVFGPVVLAPGAGAVFTASYTVPANGCGPYTSTLVASGQDKCFSHTVTNSTTVACPGTSNPGIRVAKVCPSTPVQPGGTLNYSGSVTNIGNVTLNNVTVVNGSTTVYGPATLAPGARATFTGSYTVPLDSCGPYVDTLLAQGTSICGQTVQDSVTLPCPGTNAPAIRVTKSCPASPVPPGGVLAYSGTVTNTGNITLTNVVVVNNLPQPNTIVFGPADLPPGAGAHFSGSYAVALDSCGPYSDTVVASGADKCFGKVVTSSATANCPGVSSPGISITQTCPPAPTPIGSNLIFSATVLNTGNITLTNVVVVNDRPASGTTVFRTPSLAPGASTNFTGSFVVPASLDACTIANTLVVTSGDKCSGSNVTATVSTTCNVTPSPAITVTKNCPATPVSPGGVLTFTGTVHNGGNVTLSNITVVIDHPAPGTIVFTAPSLAAGATASFTGSYTVPVDECSVSDTVSVTAVDRCGNQVSNSTTTTCPIATTPAVAISRTCPSAPVLPGAEMALLGYVTNTGNITLTNVTIVVDRPATNTLFFGPITLAPGQSSGFIGSFTVPANVGACSISSTLTVRGNNKCTGAGVTASAFQTCPLVTAPRIIVTKACPPTAPAQGTPLVFSGTVSNAGTITLTNIVVVNSQPASNTFVFAAASLAPGQITNFTGSYTTPGNCCTVSDTLTATAKNSCDGAIVTDTATSICPVQFTPLIKITKTCTNQPALPGQPLMYSGTISNAGNITLTEVVVYNSMTGVQNPVLELSGLAPGEVWSFSGDFTVPNDFCGPDSVIVTAVSICGNVSVTNTATSTCPVQTTPGITIVSVGPSQPVVHGQPATFAGTVKNIGNVTLTNVLVVDSQPAANSPVLGPVTLAPGQTTNFTYTYTAPTDCNCCELVNTFAVSGRDRCASRQVAATFTIVSKYLTHPAVVLALNCPTGGTAGQSTNVTGTVMNAGDITLTNVIVTTAGGTKLVGPITLGRGESEDFATTYTIGGSLQVLASAVDACTGLTVTNQNSCGQATPPLVVSTPSIAGGVVTLAWSSTPGVTYRVQSSTNIINPTWVAEPGDVMATGASASKGLPVKTGTTTVYFRVVALH
jgi:uncharacterized repeat protein (TIGR01451 family)